MGASAISTASEAAEPQASDAGLRSAARAQSGDQRIPVAPVALLGSCPPTMTGRAWRSMLAALDQVTTAGQVSTGGLLTGRGRDALERVADLLHLPPLRDDPVARDYAIAAALPAARPREGLPVLLRLTGTVHGSDLRSAIRAAGRAAEAGGSSPLTADVVEIVARFEEADGTLIEACGRLGRRLDRAGWEELDGRLRDAPVSARRRLAAIRRRSGRLPGWIGARLPS